MSLDKGRIKLKINIPSDGIKTEKSDSLISACDNEENNESKEKHQNKEDNADDSAIGSSKKAKEKSLEKQIISIISKLTKIVCICENKNNNLDSDNSGKIHKKLVTQMYKYEKSLNHLNSFINDTDNNNLYDITFPLGLIKVIDNYNAGDSWIYKYLLLEQKKYNDMHRNLIQNISAFDATLRTKIVNKEIEDITMPIYASVEKEKRRNFLNNELEPNYYKNIHIPKELANHYINDIKKRKLQ